jgi:hypothetical protein
MTLCMSSEGMVFPNERCAETDDDHLQNETVVLHEGSCCGSVAVLQKVRHIKGGWRSPTARSTVSTSAPTSEVPKAFPFSSLVKQKESLNTPAAHTPLFGKYSTAVSTIRFMVILGGCGR